MIYFGHSDWILRRGYYYIKTSILNYKIKTEVVVDYFYDIYNNQNKVTLDSTHRELTISKDKQKDFTISTKNINETLLVIFYSHQYESYCKIQLDSTYELSNLVPYILINVRALR